MKARGTKFKILRPEYLHCVRSCTLCKGKGGSMTANQVAYWELQESKRHNRLDEQIRSDTQRAQEQRFREQSQTEARHASVAERNATTSEKRQQAEKSHWDAQDATSVIDSIGRWVQGGVQTGATLATLFA